MAIIASSAQADDAFSILEIRDNQAIGYCYGINHESYMIAPNHCFLGKNDLYAHNSQNPILATKIEDVRQVNSYDLAIISNIRLKPPIGEYSQPGLSCSSLPMLDYRFAHSCSNLERGDSGRIINSGQFTGMHLGLIKINGITFGFGLDYKTIINGINKNDIN